MRKIFLGTFLALCLALGGCGLLIGGLIRDSGRKTQEESQVLVSLDRYRQLVLHGDAERLADMYAPRGELRHNAEKPLLGPQQIRLFLKNFADHQVQSFELRARSTIVEEGAVKQRGTYHLRVLAPHGSDIQAGGEFEATWVHEPDGRWLLSRMHTFAPAWPNVPG